MMVKPAGAPDFSMSRLSKGMLSVISFEEVFGSSLEQPIEKESGGASATTSGRIERSMVGLLEGSHRLTGDHRAHVMPRNAAAQRGARWEPPVVGGTRCQPVDPFHRRAAPGALHAAVARYIAHRRPGVVWATSVRMARHAPSKPAPA